MQVSCRQIIQQNLATGCDVRWEPICHADVARYITDDIADVIARQVQVIETSAAAQNHIRSLFETGVPPERRVVLVRCHSYQPA